MKTIGPEENVNEYAAFGPDDDDDEQWAEREEIIDAPDDDSRD